MPYLLPASLPPYVPSIQVIFFSRFPTHRRPRAPSMVAIHYFSLTSPDHWLLGSVNFIFIFLKRALYNISFFKKIWLLLSSNPKFSTCSLSCSIHPRDKQTVAYRLHLGARAVAYGEKNLIFQGPLPEKIELLTDKGLLNLTYSQQIHAQRQDKIFEVRRRAGTIALHPVLGVRFSPH